MVRREKYILNGRDNGMTALLSRVHVCGGERVHVCVGGGRVHMCVGGGRGWVGCGGGGSYHTLCVGSQGRDAIVARRRGHKCAVGRWVGGLRERGEKGERKWVRGCFV